MKTTHRNLATAAAALTLSLSMALAQAQPGGMGAGPGPMGGGAPCAGAGPGWAMKGGNMVTNADARLASVKSRLNIAANQEAAWQAYADKVKEQAQRVQTLRETHPAASLNGPDRQAFRANMMRQRADEMDAIAQASRGLYATLTPEQKQIFDTATGPMAGRGMRGPGWN